MGIGLNLDSLDATVEGMLSAARIPGAALAIAMNGEVVCARGYGMRDSEARLPANSQTIYPIASTSKAFTTTLLGMLVDEGRLAWDAPVQSYLPGFRLRDAVISGQVTIRDLVTMRTGLPRHDWLWLENPMSRAELVERLRHLELSAGFRERFQYNNLTVTTAGHVAEAVTGQSWEDLVQKRILEPLGMGSTGFVQPTTSNLTLSYHENSRREVLLSERLASDVTGPSGGSIHSNVEDMARWVLFNLNGGKIGQRQLIQPQTLAEIQAPQVTARADPTSPTPEAAYAMGWFVDTYNGHARITHGGYLHDINGEVTLFPQDRLGIVSFTNFGFPQLARLVNQHAFDLINGSTPVQSVEEKLGQYEKKIEAMRQRNAAVPRVANTAPSHPLADYAGTYVHPGYGRIEIQRNGAELTFIRNRLILPLQHWHYDGWVARDAGRFFLHVQHAFDTTGRFAFETNPDGAIASVSIRLEPAVAPIRFEKQQGPPA